MEDGNKRSGRDLAPTKGKKGGHHIRKQRGKPPVPRTRKKPVKPRGKRENLMDGREVLGGG